MTISDRVYQTHNVLDKVSENDYPMFNESRFFSPVDIFPS